MRTLLLAALVALPLAAHAEEVWRWRDARGRLHYSNVDTRVPEHATRVRTRLGHVSGDLPLPDPQMIADMLAAAEQARAEREERAARREEDVASYRPRAFWACPVYPYRTPEAWLCSAWLQLAAREAGLGS